MGIASSDSLSGQQNKHPLTGQCRERWEEPAIINRFKTESEHSRRVEISTLHKVLAILRAAIRWGQAQTPPLIDKSPFHRFGVRLNTKAETVRDRRLPREE